MLLRAVVREDMSMAMVDELIKDIQRAIEWLDHHYTFTDAEVSPCICPNAISCFPAPQMEC